MGEGRLGNGCRSWLSADRLCPRAREVVAEDGRLRGSTDRLCPRPREVVAEAGRLRGAMDARPGGAGASQNRDPEVCLMFEPMRNADQLTTARHQAEHAEGMVEQGTEAQLTLVVTSKHATEACRDTTTPHAHATETYGKARQRLTQRHDCLDHGSNQVVQHCATLPNHMTSETQASVSQSHVKPLRSGGSKTSFIAEEPVKYMSLSKQFSCCPSMP